VLELALAFEHPVARLARLPQQRLVERHGV
jgi:hypothetical protein